MRAPPMSAVAAALRAPRRPQRASTRGFAVLAHHWTGGTDAASNNTGRVAVLLHGILGSKANWNTPAKRLRERVEAQGWRVLQIDHRAHGQSPAGTAPHSLEACAADVLETLVAAGVHPDRDELVVCGHSFGGKVALTFLQARLEQRKPPPRKTWIFDSVPGRPVVHSAEQQEKEQSVGVVLAAVEKAAARGAYASRAALVAALQDEGRLRKPLAQWVAQSVRSGADGVRLSYDVPVIREMYDRYSSTDMWHVLEDASAPPVGVVVAGRNNHAWGPENLEHLQRCGDHVEVVMLESAGHNVHVDDLPGLLDAIAPSFA